MNVRNPVLAGQTVTMRRGVTYTCDSSGAVDVDPSDIANMEDLGFYRTESDSPKFFSVEVPLNTTGLQTSAHSLGSIPIQVFTAVKCTDAGGQGDYAQNEQCPYPLTAPSINGPPLSFDATNCYVLVEGAGLTLTDKLGGSSFSLTTTKWSLVIWAMATK